LAFRIGEQVQNSALFRVGAAKLRASVATALLILRLRPYTVR